MRKITTHPLKNVKGLSVEKTAYNSSSFYLKIIRDSDKEIIQRFDYKPLKGFKKFLALFNEVLGELDWELAHKDSSDLYKYWDLRKKMLDRIDQDENHLFVKE
jgi:hypothetical protein